LRTGENPEITSKDYLSLFKELRELMETDEMELDTIGDRKTALFVIIILQLCGVCPFFSDKFDITERPKYKSTMPMTTESLLIIFIFKKIYSTKCKKYVMLKFMK